MMSTSFGKVKKRKGKKWDTIFIMAMLGVPIMHWLVFWFYVNMDSIMLAFQTPLGDWSLNSIKIVLLEIRAVDSQLGIAVRNTLVYFTKNTLMIFFQLIIAYFLYKKIWGYKTFRIIFYLPAIISGVAMTTMFANFVSRSGPLGEFLKILGVTNMPDLLADSTYATPTILFYTIWLGWGGHMLILGGTLARVPVEVLESAKLDGITPARELVSMIIPLIWPTISTLLILNMTGLFTASGPILLFTKGDFRTTTIGYWIFKQVYEIGIGAYNIVAAAGLMFTVIGVPIILLFKWLIEKIPTVEY